MIKKITGKISRVRETRTLRGEWTFDIQGEIVGGPLEKFSLSLENESVKKLYNEHALRLTIPNVSIDKDSRMALIALKPAGTLITGAKTTYKLAMDLSTTALPDNATDDQKIKKLCSILRSKELVILLTPNVDPTSKMLTPGIFADIPITMILQD